MDVQAQPVGTRADAFACLRVLAVFFPAVCSGQQQSQDAWRGDATIAGFVECMERERDPRCLLPAFDTAAALARLMPPVSSSVEDLFDACACYFPVCARARDGRPAREHTPCRGVE